MSSIKDPLPVDWAGLLALTAIWGSSFAVTKLAVESLAPMWVVALRMGIGALVLLAMAAFRREWLDTTPRYLGWYAVLAVVGAVAPFFLISWGTARTASSTAGIIMAMIPLFAVALAHLFLGDERLSARRAVGFVVGFCGLTIVIGLDTLAGIRLSARGFPPELAILAAAFCYALHGVMVRLGPPMSALQLALGEIGVGAAIAVPLAIALAPAGLATMTAVSFLAVLALGVFPTAVAGLVLFWLLPRAGVGFVAYCNYLLPVFAAVLGVLAFGEVLQPRIVLGMLVILAGIAIAETRRMPRGQIPDRT